ncbi:MAG TPA: hypothetical protein VFA46_07605 [Actinomycetes bacterium]|nr:hypothetical protein [Actinomycetes bacterium]
MRMVTPEGAYRTVDDASDPELMWGLRGGGNFGVVTEFRFRTHRCGPRVVAGFVVYHLDEGARVLGRLAEFAAGAPDEVTTVTFLRLAPPVPWMPAATVGQPVVMVGAVYAGPVEEGLVALRRLGAPLVDALAPRPFLEHQTVIDAANPAGHRYYWKSAYVAGLGDGLIDLVVEQAAGLSSPLSLIGLFQLGGAAARGGDRSCLPTRQAAFLVDYASHWVEPREDDQHITWTRTAMERIAPYGLGAGYANFEADGAAPTRHAFPPDSHRRLVALKNAHDPTNTLHLNANIAPSPPQ